LELFSLEKRRFRRDLIAAFQWGLIRKMRTNLLAGPNAVTQGVMVLNLKKGSFRLNISKNFFTMRVVKHWKRLPRGMGDAPWKH